jgi:FkbM family methyltransferase
VTTRVRWAAVDPAPETGWRPRAKARLKPLRDRVVRRLGGTVPERGVTYEQLVHLLYPNLPEHRRAAVDEAGAGDLSQVSTIRRMLGAVEHQDAPTPFSVQIMRDEVLECAVGPVELLCDPADGAVAPGLRSGSYEPHLTEVFERYCRPGMTVVDVGANLGYFTVLASKLVGPSGHVIAVEPNSDNCRLLLSSLGDQRITNVELLPVACDTETGWAYYSSHVGSNGGLVDDQDLLSRPGAVVPTFRLDALVAGPVGFLKLDVEGAEGRVVKGATGLLERHRPVVTTELKQEMLERVSDMSLLDYLGYFEQLGYSATMLDAASGSETLYPTMAALLHDWKDLDEIADILLLPEGGVKTI